MKKNNDPIGDILTVLVKGLSGVFLMTFRLLKKGILKLFGKTTVSEKQRKAVTDELTKIAFKDRAGNYPKLIGYKYDASNKAHEYIFKSSIPFTDWHNSKLSLSTALDKNVYSIEEYRSKQKTRIVAIDTSVRLPIDLVFDIKNVINDDVTFIIGKGLLSEVTVDITKAPHVLIGGGTGSGKSVAMQLIVGQAILKGWSLDFIDFKRVEFGQDFEQYGEVANDADDMSAAQSIVRKHYLENDARMKLFERTSVRNIGEYNEKFPHEPLAYSGLVIDEIAELLDIPKGIAKEEKEIMQSIASSISSLARLGRAQGCFIFMAMQRPEANILPGQIRDMMNVRLGGHFPNAEAYRMVLGSEASQVSSADYIMNSWEESKAEDTKKVSKHIRISEKKNIAGRFAFVAGTSVKMVQVYYYVPTMLASHQYRMKGRLANGYAKQSAPQSTSSPVEMKFDKPIRTIKVDGKVRRKKEDDGVIKPENSDVDTGLDFNFDFIDTDFQSSHDEEETEA